MKFATVLAGLLVIAFALPAAAQTDEDFYVVQNVKTRTCTVTHQKPTGAEYTTVSPDGTIYKTKIEAQNAMKTIKVCHTD